MDKCIKIKLQQGVCFTIICLKHEDNKLVDASEYIKLERDHKKKIIDWLNEGKRQDSWGVGLFIEYFKIPSSVELCELIVDFKY